MQQYSLSCDTYKSNICTGFSSLQQNGEFVDMTLAADGCFVKVHQAIVALSSPYLKSIITSAPCQHPVIFLNNISYRILTSLLEYMYTGEVLIQADNLYDFVNAAKSLHIKGLENIVNEEVTKGCTGTEEIVEQMGLPFNAKKIIVKEEKTPEVSTFNRSCHSSLDADVYKNTLDYTDTMDDTGGPDSDYDVKENSTQKYITNRITDNTEKFSSKLQYSVSIRGSLQIILNRYIYNLTTTRKKGIRRWRCVDYRCHKCNAFVITKDSVVLNRANMHNHTFHDKKILSKIQKNMIFAALEDCKAKANINKEDSEDNDKSMEYEEFTWKSDVES